MIIRDMNKEDIGRVRAIAKDTWRDTYSSFIPEEIQDKVLAEAYSQGEMSNRFESCSNLVAEEDGEIMGYAFLTDKKQEHHLFVESLYIHPTYQGRGIGRQLLQKGVAMYPLATVLSLTVYKGNPNISFYEKEGFKAVKENKGSFFEHPVSFILMEKELS